MVRQDLEATGDGNDDGEDDDTSSSTPLGSSRRELANVSYQRRRNRAGVVDGVAYSGHAFDQMQNRGITHTVVQHALEHGEPFETRPDTFGLYNATNKIRVIVNASTRQVVTVIPGAPK